MLICRYTCIFLYTQRYTHACMHTRIHMHAHMHARMLTHTCMHVCTPYTCSNSTDSHVCAHTCMHMHSCARTHMHTLAPPPQHTYTHTRAHTHTHTLNTNFPFLQQMQLLSGNVKVTGRIAYVGQEPWIFNGTARENIVFGCPYDKEK